MCTCSVEISEQLVVTLTVSESTMEDAGEYLVRVYNEFGEATSTTRVNVIFEAPAFTSPPADQQVRPTHIHNSSTIISTPVTVTFSATFLFPLPWVGNSLGLIIEFIDSDIRAHL